MMMTKIMMMMRIMPMRYGVRRLSTTSVLSRHSNHSIPAADLGKNLSQFDILAGSEMPSNNIEMISKDAIVFSDLQVIKSPQMIRGEKSAIGSLLLHNQIFEINLGKESEVGSALKKSHLVSLPLDILTIFKLVYPKPELLVVGLGAKTRMLDPNTKSEFNKLGIRLEVSNTKNAALTFDLLATERSSSQVSAFILPPNI